MKTLTLILCCLSPALAFGQAQAGIDVPRALKLSAPALAMTPGEARLRSVGWSFVPLGIGQFANGQAGKGLVFFALETGCFATAAGALAAVESDKVVSYGFLQGGKFRDVTLAERLQATYVAAFWSGMAIAVLGIADALLSRPSAPVTGRLESGGVALAF